MNGLAVTLEDVTFGYEEDLPVLEAFNLDVNPSSIVGLIGPSGSGKSTILGLMGLLESPDNGSVLWQDQQTAGWSDDRKSKQRRQNVAYIFQDHMLDPKSTVAQNVALPFAFMTHRVSKKERMLQTSKALELVGIGSLALRKPPEMSGGQRQRVAIARALINDPQLMLIDEPTASLDKKNSQQVMEAFMEINQRLGTSIVFATHDPIAISFAERQINIERTEVYLDRAEA